MDSNSEDPNDSEDPNEALEIYFRVSKVHKFKLKKESEETIDAFLAITEDEPRRIFVCPTNISSDKKIEPFEIKNYQKDKKEYLIKGTQIEFHFNEEQVFIKSIIEEQLFL